MSPIIICLLHNYFLHFIYFFFMKRAKVRRIFCLPLLFHFTIKGVLHVLYLKHRFHLIVRTGIQKIYLVVLCISFYMPKAYDCNRAKQSNNGRKFVCSKLPSSMLAEIKTWKLLIGQFSDSCRSAFSHNKEIWLGWFSQSRMIFMVERAGLLRDIYISCLYQLSNFTEAVYWWK